MPQPHRRKRGRQGRLQRNDLTLVEQRLRDDAVSRERGSQVEPRAWPGGPGLINIDELSQRLSIATGTLYNWVYLRRIPFIKAGRCVRFDYDAVLAALRQGTLEEVSRR